jgi:hypothetical protein
MADDTTTPHLGEPDPARRPARIALYAGVAAIAVGGVVMYLGYNGAATNPLPQAQTPYVISGGLLGLALMALGGVAIALYVLLQVQADLRSELHGMRETMELLAESIARQMFGAGASVASSQPSANGTVYVARGASSYHRSDCRLVARADHVKPLARADAGSAGLVPCRICKP